jgi:hypothetical protein
MHWVGFEAMLSTVARFLSFASLEVAQFIGTDTAKRVMFALVHLWIVPLLAIVWVAGLAQPVWMAWTWFARRHPARAEWPAVKTLVLATVLLIVAAYCFASVPPQAHAFYAVAPIAFVYAAYCFAGIDSPRWRRVAAALLAVNIAFQLGVAFILGPTRSLYLHRDVVAAAVSRRDPDLLAHRREFAMDARPEDADPRRDPRDELTLAEPEWSLHPVRAVVWHVTVRNDSTTRAYRDLLYRAVYRDASGNVLDTRHGLVRDVFEPGEPRRVEINDGSVRVPFASATIEVILAEALKPLR